MDSAFGASPLLVVVVSHSVGGERDSGREGLAEREEVRLEPPRPGEAGVGADERVCLVDREEGARAAGRIAERLVVSGLRQKEPGVGHRRLRQHEGDVARLERGLQRGDVVELDDAGLVGDSRGQAPALGNYLAALLDHQRRVAFAVVLGVEHQHDLSPRQLTSEADHLGVCLGGREGELPLRQPVAAGEVLGDGDRVLAGQQKLVSELDSPGDRFDDRGRRVAAEGAHISHIHVEVGVPVDVGETGAPAMRHPNRRMVVEVVHPCHRHAPRHRAARSLDERQRPRPLSNESSVLGFLQPPDAC